MPKAKTNSSDKVLCACGCKRILSRRQQTRHLQARGPVMAVAEVIETRAYFRRHRPKSLGPQKRQRNRAPRPASNDFPVVPPEELGHPPLDPLPTPAPAQEPSFTPGNQTISEIAHEALSAPWMGLPDVQRRDDDFEDLSDTDSQTTSTSGSTKPAVSDTDSETDDEGDGPDGSSGGFHDIFETGADLNTTEYSQCSRYADPWSRLSPTPLLRTAPDDLSIDDLDLLRLFSLQIDDPTVTDKLLTKIARLSKCNLGTLYRMKKRLEDLSELMAESYDCCVKSCVAFTGPHAKLKACPRCRKPRYRQDGKPMKTYRYLPLIPQLVMSFLNRELNERMRYRSNKTKANDSKIADIFDGSHYHELLQKEVTLNGHSLGHTYFSDDRDIALGLATDGVNPWQR